ncbi:piggyBac transposable element-derived protein 3-like [Ixodes scapularis]
MAEPLALKAALRVRHIRPDTALKRVRDDERKPADQRAKERAHQAEERAEEAEQRVKRAEQQIDEVQEQLLEAEERVVQAEAKAAFALLYLLPNLQGIVYQFAVYTGADTLKKSQDYQLGFGDNIVMALCDGLPNARSFKVSFGLPVVPPEAGSRDSELEWGLSSSDLDPLSSIGSAGAKRGSSLEACNLDGSPGFRDPPGAGGQSHRPRGAWNGEAGGAEPCAGNADPCARVDPDGPASTLSSRGRAVCTAPEVPFFCDGVVSVCSDNKSEPGWGGHLPGQLR